MSLNAPQVAISSAGDAHAALAHAMGGAFVLGAAGLRRWRQQRMGELPREARTDSPPPPGAGLADCARQARELRIAPNAEQAALTDRVVRPLANELREAERRCRRMADGELRAGFAAGDFPPGCEGLDPAEYPHGFCFSICNRVFDLLSKQPLVQRFRGQGVLWKKVYFIQDGRLFQNAIQCGDYLLDVANDTHTSSLPPVSLKRLDDVRWENLDDFRQTARTAEKYYRVRLFPNFYFPELFPVAPFFALRESGRLGLFWHEHLLFFQDFDDGFPRLRALLDDAEWMARDLPSAPQSLLDSLLAGHANSPPPVLMRKCAAHELKALLDEWNASLRELPPARFGAMLARLDSRLQAAAAWLESAP